MINKHSVSSVSCNHLNGSMRLVEPNSKNLIFIRRCPVLLHYKIPPSILDFPTAQIMLERVLVHNDFDHRYLLSLNEIILQGERLSNSYKQALPR